MWTDQTKSATTVVSKSFNFELYMQPCIVSSYVAAQKVSEIRYQLKSPSLTEGRYVFDEVPFCGYSETVTLAGLPSFVTHNASTSDFTVPLNGDMSLIGEYLVNIKSSICVPKDYTKSLCTSMTVNYNFKVIVEACMVTSFKDTLTVATITYVLGSSTLVNISPYEFTELPDCGYPKTVSLTNLPAFVSHNSVGKDFTVPKFLDLFLIGSYIVTIRSEIKIPLDAA